MSDNITVGRAAFFPYTRVGVGFDRIFGELDRLMNINAASNSSYPPFNLEKTGDNSYRITMAVAGFTDKDIEVTQKENTLTVIGHKEETDEDRTREYIHRGIANRSFTRELLLADHVEVKVASLKDGLLVIDMEETVPEELKPRKIPLLKGKA